MTESNMQLLTVYLVTGVQRSQQHDSSCGRTVNVLVFCIQSVRSQESETKRSNIYDQWFQGHRGLN